MQDVDSWNQPRCQLLVCTLRLIEHLDLGSKQVENGTRSTAGLQLDGQGMRGNVFLRLFAVRFQCISDDCLKARGRGGGRWHAKSVSGKQDNEKDT